MEIKKIKEFEKATMAAVDTLREQLGVKRIDMEIHSDNYENNCRTVVTFYTSIPADASGCGPACKAD